MTLSIRTTLVGIVATISVIGVGLAVMQGTRAVTAFSQARSFEVSQRTAAQLQDAAGRMAVERGLMAVALASSTVTAPAITDIQTAGKAANDAVRAALQLMTAEGMNTAAVTAALAQADAARQTALSSLNGGSRDGPAWFKASTGAIEAVLHAGTGVANKLVVTPEVFLTEGLAVTEELALTAEMMGRQRGIVASVIAGGKPLTPAQMRDFAVSRGAIVTSLSDIEARANHLGPEFAAAAGEAIKSRQTMKEMLDGIVQASDQGTAYPVDSATWFATATKAIGQVQASRKAITDLMQQEVSGFQRTSFVGLVLSGLLILLCVAAAGGGAWVISRRVLRPLRDLGGAVERFSREDYAATVACADRADEMGAMARSIDVLKSRGIEAVELRAAQATERAEAEDRKRAALEGMAQKVETETRVAVDEVARQTKEMQSHADAMSMSAALVSTNSQSVAAAAEQALHNAETVASAAEELSSSIREIAAQVSHAGTVSNRAVAKGEATRETIGTLSETVSKVSEVTSLIAEIAAQTNLLALNATIEAARAGEAGKGFAVVASEVKNLAGQTARATEEIGRQISAIESATRSAVEAVGEIGRTIAEMDEISGAIAAAVEEQGAATQEISRNVLQAADASREVTARIADVSTEAAHTGERATTVHTTTTEVSDAIADLRATLVRVVRTSMVEVDRRTDTRFPVKLDGQITIDGQLLKITIADLSRGGARVAPAPQLGSGRRGTLHVSGVAAGISFECLSNDGSTARLRFTADDQVLDMLKPLLSGPASKAA